MFLQHQSSLFRERYYNGKWLLLKSSKKLILSLNLWTVCLVLSSSIHLLTFSFIPYSGLKPTCFLDSLPDEVILQILSSFHQVLYTVARVSKRFYRLSHHCSLWRIFKHMWLTKRSFENTVVQHAVVISEN